MKPLISYYGGKQRLAPLILSLMPPSYKCFVEPFCGGASVFFALPLDKKRSEVLNDKDERIITLYRVAKTNGDELAKMIDSTPYSRACHAKASEIYKNPNEHDELNVAWAVYVSTIQGFGYKPARGWAFNVQGRNSPNVWKNKKTDILSQISRLDNCYLECDDALNVIKRWDSVDTFFYVDPPYPNTDCGNYRGYKVSDYQNLIDCLSNIKGKFILSNYWQQVQMPESWKIFEKELTCCAGNGRNTKASSRTELLIMNYDKETSFFD